MKKTKLFLILGCFLPVLTSAQIIIGVVRDSSNNTAVQYATVALLYNNSLFSGTITNEKGKFSLPAVRKGIYTLQISFVGFVSYKKSVEIKGEKQNLGIIYLSPATRKIGEVTVEADKNIYSQLVDKTVVTFTPEEIKNKPRALQALETVSGLLVDASKKSIKIMGKENVLILINGINKSVQEVAMLKTKDIKRIEIIKNPGAQYESTYSAVLNIVTSKNSLKGFALDTELYAFVPNIYNFSDIELQYGFDKIKFFGYYGLFLRRSAEKNNNINRYQSGDNVFETYDSITDARKRLQIEHYVNYGTDIFLNKKNFIETAGDYSYYNQDIPFKFRSSVFVNNTEVKRLNILQNSLYTDRSANYYLYYRHDINPDNYLYLYADYYHTTMVAEYYDYTGKQIQEQNKKNAQFRSSVNADKISQNYKIHYSGVLHKIKVDMGAYSYIRDLNNYSLNYGDSISRLRYREIQNNTFINASKKLKKIAISAGLAVEYQDYTLNSTTQNNSLNLLPSLAIQFVLSDKQSLQFSYARKLKYPTTQELNPYYYTSDSLTFYQGNPNVQVFTLENIQLEHSFRYNGIFISTRLFYTYSKNPVQWSLSIENNTKYFTYANDGEIKKLGIDINSSFKLFKKLKLKPAFTFSQVNYSGSKGNWIGNVYKVSISPRYLYSNGLELGIRFYYKGRETIYQGYKTMFPSIDLVAQKSFFDDNLVCHLTIEPFNTRYSTFYKTANTYVEQTRRELYKNINLEIDYSLQYGKHLKSKNVDVNTDSDF